MPLFLPPFVPLSCKRIGRDTTQRLMTGAWITSERSSSPHAMVWISLDLSE